MQQLTFALNRCARSRCGGSRRGRYRMPPRPATPRTRPRTWACSVTDYSSRRGRWHRWTARPSRKGAWCAVCMSPFGGISSPGCVCARLLSPASARRCVCVCVCVGGGVRWVWQGKHARAATQSLGPPARPPALVVLVLACAQVPLLAGVRVLEAEHVRPGPAPGPGPGPGPGNGVGAAALGPSADVAGAIGEGVGARHEHSTVVPPAMSGGAVSRARACDALSHRVHALA